MAEYEENRLTKSEVRAACLSFWAQGLAFVEAHNEKCKK